MADRSGDWLEQARLNLEQAEVNARTSGHEWACFIAQQAAECAIKALHLHHKQEAWGHVLSDLLRQVPASVVVPTDLIEAASVLDNYDIPTRYANGHPSGPPRKHYTARQSREALRCAREIFEFCRLQMARS